MMPEEKKRTREDKKNVDAWPCHPECPNDRLRKKTACETSHALVMSELTRFAEQFRSAPSLPRGVAPMATSYLAGAPLIRYVVA